MLLTVETFKELTLPLPILTANILWSFLLYHLCSFVVASKILGSFFIFSIFSENLERMRFLLKTMLQVVTASECVVCQKRCTYTPTLLFAKLIEIDLAVCICSPVIEQSAKNLKQQSFWSTEITFRSMICANACSFQASIRKVTKAFLHGEQILHCC